MRGSLGEKIGEGAFSEVHAWAPGQVVKLFKAGVPRIDGRVRDLSSKKVRRAFGKVSAARCALA
jgi:hypothetical protein